MSGIGPLGGSIVPDPIRPVNKDGGGSGGGGQYRPNDQREREPHDEAELSEEARKKALAPADARPGAADARLEILSEIQSFNEHHERSGSRLKAILKPAGAGVTHLHLEDPGNHAVLYPFGTKDIFHFSPQEVRAKLQTFDRSRGSILDTKG